MIARPGASGSCRGHEPEEAAASLHDRLRAARRASRALHHDMTDWLQLRREVVVTRAGALLWRALGIVLVAVVGLAIVVTATVLTVTGTATWVGAAIGGGAGVGSLLVGASVLLLCAACLGWRRRDRGRAERGLRERAQHASTRRHARELVRAVGIAPSLAVTAIGGFGLARLLRVRSVRRAALFGLGALRHVQSPAPPAGEGAAPGANGNEQARSA